MQTSYWGKPTKKGTSLCESANPVWHT